MQGPLPRPGGRSTRAAPAERRGARFVVGEVSGLPTEAAAGTVTERAAEADSLGLRSGYRLLLELAKGRARPDSGHASQASSGDAELLATLRTALGAEEPLGMAFAELERELQASAGEPSAVRERLGRALQRATFAVGDDGATLARALRESGQCREARWLAAGFEELQTDGENSARRLAPDLLADWIGSEDGERFARELELGLRMELRAAAPHASEQATLERWLQGACVGELPRSVGVLLERALAHTSVTRVRELLLDSLRAFELDTLPRPLREALLRTLCGFSQPMRRSADVAGLAQDLKEQLLLAREELAPSALHSAVVRTLAAIEAEQWINVARQAAHLSSHWSVPVRQGEHWSTAHVFVHRSYFRSTQAAKGAAAARRLALALDAGELGIVQVELLVGADELALRVLAADEAAADALRARLPELERKLARGTRTLRTSVAVATGEPPQALDPVRALSWLVDHNVIDMEV